MAWLQDRRTWLVIAGSVLLITMSMLGAPQAEMISFAAVLAVALVGVTLFSTPKD